MKSLKKIVLMFLVAPLLLNCGGGSSQDMSVFKNKHMEYISGTKGGVKILAFDKQTNDAYIFSKSAGWLLVRPDAGPGLAGFSQRMVGAFQRIAGMETEMRRNGNMSETDAVRIFQEILATARCDLYMQHPSERKSYTLKNFGLSFMSFSRNKLQLKLSFKPFVLDDRGEPDRSPQADLALDSFTLDMNHFVKSLYRTQWARSLGAQGEAGAPMGGFPRGEAEAPMDGFL